MAGKIKTATQIENIRYSSRILGELHAALSEFIKPGVTPIQIDQFAEDFITKNKGIPSFKGWQGFPNTACVSVNEAIIHGIPDNRPLEEGDICSVDVGMIYEGGYGDTAYTFPVGKISEEVSKLMDVTYESLWAGIDQARHKKRVGDIGHAVESVINPHGYGIVREFCGHGVGESVWEDPKILNYGSPGKGERLFKNMVVAIEPMVNLGVDETATLKDKWTVVTADGKVSAHYEHTLLINDGEAEVLTFIPGATRDRRPF